MADKVLWCQWDVAPIGEKRKLCLKPVYAGSESYCKEHFDTLPVWPGRCPDCLGDTKDDETHETEVCAAGCGWVDNPGAEERKKEVANG